MSSEKFESLEDDICNLLDELKVVFDRKIPNSFGEDRKDVMRQAERKLEEANLLMQEMENEAKLAPVAFRTQMLTKIRNFRGDLDRFQRLRKKSGDSGFGGDGHGFDRDDRMEASQRAKLLQGHQSLQRASESIARSHQIAAETDQIGTEIIDELGQQRDTLERTRTRLTETDSNLGKSRRILKSMGRKVMTNKLILAVIIVLEVGTLGGVVYWKFFS